MRAFQKLKKRRTAWLVTIVAILVLGTLMPILAVMGQDDYDYMPLAGEAFMGKCNIPLRSDVNGRKVASNETIRFMATCVIAQADDNPSLILTGNWTAGRVILLGALVMGWTETYGPYTDKAAYLARNCSACTVPPDYLWLAYGEQGGYTVRGRGYTKPYMNLSGLGFALDWTGEGDVVGFGTAEFIGRLTIKKVDGDPVLSKYSTRSTMHFMWVDEGEIDPPHKYAYKNVKMNWEVTGIGCMFNALDDYDWLCEWLYELGLNLCGIEAE